MQFQVFNMNVYKLIAIMVFIIASILTMISIVVCWDGINSTISFDRAVSALIKCSIFIGAIWVLALSIVCVAGYYEKYARFEEYKRRTDEILAEVERMKKELEDRKIQNKQAMEDLEKYLSPVLNNVKKDDRPTDADKNTATKVNISTSNSK